MRSLDDASALVLFSGGQDSSIALAWALDRFERVATVGFHYGQRHKVELDARTNVRAALSDTFPAWAPRLGADTVIDLAGLGEISETALTRAVAIEMADTGLPTSFVPGRNLVFLTMAGALAYRLGAGALVAGMCEEDATGYPDCRAAALQAQIDAIRLGMDADLRLETPVLTMPKSDSWRLAETLGGEALVTLVRDHSHTCYLGERGVTHDWGAGCGACPACLLRAEGWAAYRQGSSAA